MSEPLICTAWIIACVVCLECYCEGKQRGRSDQQFFAVCMAVLLAVFGMVRWL